MIVVPYRGVLAVLAMVSLVALATLVIAIGFVAVDEIGRIGTGVCTAAGLGMLAAAAAVSRNAYVIDGERIGWRNGITGQVHRWVERSDIELRTVSQPSWGTVVYWHRSQRPTRLMQRLYRPDLNSHEKALLDELTAGGHTLRPFAVALTMVRARDRWILETFVL